MASSENPANHQTGHNRYTHASNITWLDKVANNPPPKNRSQNIENQNTYPKKIKSGDDLSGIFIPGKKIHSGSKNSDTRTDKKANGCKQQADTGG